MAWVCHRDVGELTLTGAGDDDDRIKIEDFVRQLIRIHEPFRVLKDWDVLDFDLPELAPPDGDLARAQAPSPQSTSSWSRSP